MSYTVRKLDYNLQLLLGDRKVGDNVNLERAMGAHVRFGGHFVQVRSIIPAEIMPVDI